MIYRMPIYHLRVAFEVRCPLACVFGLEGLLDTIPRLDPDLYFIDLLSPGGEPWESVATAAVHESGAWTLNFSDGREYGSNTRLIRLGKIR